jgi:TolB-like protein
MQTNDSNDALRSSEHFMRFAFYQRGGLVANIMTAMKEGMGVKAISEAEVQAALESVLESDMFINAPRMCRLLSFLGEKAIFGAVRDTREYAIGIEVFDRDPSVYSVSEDPIVRVQVGRLREKLKTYYATLGAGSDIEILIPIGSYMPVIQRKSVLDVDDSKQRSMLAIHPFKCLSHHGDAVHFTQGLNEELTHQLFKAFGKIIVAHSFFASGNIDNECWTLKDISGAGVSHLLEGSIQIDAERIRASIRLVDVSVGCIAWSEQFDRNILFSITHQEELASSICGALKQFFCHK